MRTYLVATNADYSLLVLAKDEEHAVKKANKFYKKEYDETREDWDAYDLHDLLLEEGEPMPIHSWYAWEECLKIHNIGGWHK